MAYFHEKEDVGAREQGIRTCPDSGSVPRVPHTGLWRWDTRPEKVTKRLKTSIQHGTVPIRRSAGHKKYGNLW